ncbi:hypothetical protein DICVIV_07050 [Dictyocaulus viviparus]|uniref:Uncharacterized protein n=1 Tax=Dictyocaulus viviparus TaxID=29172 RepID=A0A0D8XSY2_DICVI|nr:hypothetical protein DICVIV_07050 [Dictyocaulus viviparus]
MKKIDWRSEGVGEAAIGWVLTGAIRPLCRAVVFACSLSVLSRTPLLDRPGRAILRRHNPGDATLDTDARSPHSTTTAGLLPSLHPHQSTAWKLAHRRPPRRPVSVQRFPGYTSKLFRKMYYDMV